MLFPHLRGDIPDFGRQIQRFGVYQQHHVFDPVALGNIPAGKYLALMSHSGSRGTGAAVCNHYSKLAKSLRPEYGDMAWLDLGTKEGDEYWAAMNLMGEYASANHAVIHREISKPNLDA
jgi:RNA-splicing ligase RtcB